MANMIIHYWTWNIYRSDSYNPKTADKERKVKELSQELNLLKEDNCNKDER